jgi:hypothetical protein
MTDDTVTSVDNDVSLDVFEKDFYGNTPTQPVEEAPGEPVDTEEEVDDLGEDEVDPPATDEDEPEDEEEGKEPEPQKKNKPSARERIEQLNAKVRETERREADYARRLAELEAAVKGKAKEEEVPLREQLPANAPDPDAKDDKGEALYPLGEFDPDYIRALSKFTVEQELKVAREAQMREAEARAEAEMREELKDQWVSRLDEFEEEVPEVRENIRGLTDAFATLDPGYGEILAATLMSMDNGPAIMNYLSQNIGEAQKIVTSGPGPALLALGRLDAILTPKKEPEKKKKTSNAPPPPEDRTRGTKGRFAVRPDTDNLEAFEKEFFS